jgi:rhodanese-related sulfurtransferase
MSLPVITAHQAKEMLSRGALLVDIRERDEHAREKIAGARNVPLSDIQPGKTVADASTIIFHCRTGTRTRNCAEVLAKAAPAGAVLLEDGIEGWKKAGMPVVTDRKQPIEIMRQVQIAAGGLTVLGAVLGLLVNPAFYGLSASVGAGLLFAGLTGSCAMASLLKSMPWNRQTA